jgi:hypothetical protein
VPLSGFGIRRREAIIDEESLPLVQGRRWCFSEGSSGGQGTVTHAKLGDATPLRRVIMGVTGTELNVGHVNGDSLDCRRENLYVKTVAERTRGTRKRASHGGRALQHLRACLGTGRRRSGACRSPRTGRRDTSAHSAMNLPRHRSTMKPRASCSANTPG